MTKVAVMTDTNSGFTKADAEKAGVFLQPMPFMINGKSYHEGVDIDFPAFYAYLQNGADVSTSQPMPGEVITLWDSILAQGYDEIVYIPMSSGLSNSCQTALVLAQEYGNRVQVVDNHRISVTLKQSVFDALILGREGKSALEIKQILEQEAYDASIFISVDTLEYLKKGGRVTAAGAAIGTVLNIKPVLTIQGDKLDAFAKVRGMKTARKTMIHVVKQDLQERFSQLYAAGKLGVYFAYTDLPQEVKQSWEQELQQAFPEVRVVGDPLAMSIGCHIGPGALAVGICRTRISN